MKRFLLIFAIFNSLMFRNTMGQIKDTSKNEDFTPDWAKQAIWYQIFPERFRNGDGNNDPKVENIEGSYPHDIKSPFQTHPWGSDWYELQPYEKLNNKDISFNLQRRRYGGDLQGIIDKLDYLQELGINAIYLNPVFVAPSSHKYDAASWHHIDPTFGPDPEGDLKIIASEVFNDPKTWQWTSADKLALKLIAEVHKRKMKIIFDGVFNHLGITSFPFKDVKKNQKNSVYKDWFKIKSFDDPKAGTKFEYEGWFGVKELPEINQDENGITAEPRKYIFEITNRWMNPNSNGDLTAGIDGWRLDVAFCIKHPFWKVWRKFVKNINPEAYLTAEVIDKIDVVKPYVQGDEFDAVMNYNFGFACAEFFAEDKTGINAKQFDSKLKTLRESFSKSVTYVQQNLFGSHDANRIASHIVNKGLGIGYRNWGNYFGASQSKNKIYDTRKPNSSEIEVQKLIAIMQMTYIGAPMIYYGDEVGMWGANDPDCRKPMIWEDIQYADEKVLPNQNLKPIADKVEVNRVLFGWYKKLISIRKENKALLLGDFLSMPVENQTGIFAFKRTYQGEIIITILNNSIEKQTYEFIPVEAAGSFIDLITEKIFYSENGKIVIPLSAKTGVILKPKP